MIFNRIAFRFAIPITFGLHDEIVVVWKMIRETFFSKTITIVVQHCSFFSVCSIKSAYSSRFWGVKRIAVLEQMFVNILIKSDISKLKAIFFECNAFRFAIPILLATATTTLFCKICDRSQTKTNFNVRLKLDS